MTDSRSLITIFTLVHAQSLRWLVSAPNTESASRAQAVQLSNLASKLLTPTFKLFFRCAAVLSVALLIAPPAALAHPMGNFSVNHYCKILINPNRIELDYIIDMAEIPTFQEIQQSGILARLDDPALGGYLERQSETLKQGLRLVVAAQPLDLHTVLRQVIFPPGAGGLPTMKLGFVYQATVPAAFGASSRSLHYEDNNFVGRAGWKEIVATVKSGVALVSSSAPQSDRSLELTNYPTDLLHSPPQLLQADMTFKAIPTSDAANQNASNAQVSGWLDTSKVTTRSGIRLAANRQDTPRSAFTDLMASNRTDLAFLVAAAIIAALLGGFHALEPGHGKTLVAAYLVGSHGKARHAVLLGAIVTASHTISVYALGIVTLYASQWIMPEQLYPWLGMASGLVVAGLGLALFVHRYRTTNSQLHFHGAHDTHSHGHIPGDAHGHDHENHGSGAALSHRHTWWGGHVHRVDDHVDAGSRIHQEAYHENEGDAAELGRQPAEDSKALSLASLFGLGVTGGIVPCPAALVVLLGALAFHRIALGIFLIVAFSAGLAAVLISFGLAMVYAGRFMSRLGSQNSLTQHWLPLASSAVITAVGVMLTLQSLITAGIVHIGS
jgi:ABC-type nickel/cobalt efflux system permease component RcnA